MSCSASIIATGVYFEELALSDQQIPVCKKIFSMYADPRPYLDSIVRLHFTCEPIAGFDVKGRFPTRMPCMNVRFLMAFPDLGAHRDKNAKE